MSAALRPHRCFYVLLAVLVPVLLYFVLLAPGSMAVVPYRILTTCSSAVAVSLILSRDTSCGRLHFAGCLACTSNTTTQRCALRDRWLAVGARAPRWCRLQQRVLLTVRTGLRGSLPLRSIGGFQHHSYTTVILWAVSTFKTKAYIAASCHGVVRRFVQHRWRVIDPRVSLVWFLSLKISVCLVTVTRYFPSRVFMTFFLAWHVGATHAFDLYRSFCWMRISVFSCFCLLLCTVFLLNAAVFADLALYLAVCGLASVEAFLLSYHSRASSTSGTVSSAAYPWSFSRSLFSQARRLEICNIEPGDCAAGCSRSGIKNQDFVASHHLGHLGFSWHVWSHCSFLRDLDLFLKLHHVEEFPGCPHFVWDICCVELERQNFSGFPHCDHTLLVQLSVSVWFQKAEIQSCWRDGESIVQIRSFTILFSN